MAMRSLGFILRPYKYDFGFRYLHKHLPPELSQKIESLIYNIDNMETLRDKTIEADRLFYEAVAQAKQTLSE